MIRRIEIILHSLSIIVAGACFLLFLYVAAGSGGGMFIRWQPPMYGSRIIPDDGLGIPSEWVRPQYLRAATRPSDITVEFLNGPLVFDKPPPALIESEASAQRRHDSAAQGGKSE